MADNVIQLPDDAQSFRAIGGGDLQPITGRAWDVCVIRSGLAKPVVGEHGERFQIFWAADVLRQAVADGLFENVPVEVIEFQHNDGNKGFGHTPASARAAAPQGFPRTVVGTQTNARIIELPENQVEVRARVDLFDGQLQDRMLHAVQAGAPLPFGLSIDVQGKAGMTQYGIYELQAIYRVYANAIVTNPTAGGAFLRAVAGETITEGGSQMPDTTNTGDGGGSAPTLDEMKLKVAAMVGPEKAAKLAEITTADELLAFCVDFMAGASAAPVDAMAGEQAAIEVAQAGAAVKEINALVSQIKQREAVDATAHAVEQVIRSAKFGDVPAAHLRQQFAGSSATLEQIQAGATLLSETVVKLTPVPATPLITIGTTEYDAREARLRASILGQAIYLKDGIVSIQAGGSARDRIDPFPSGSFFTEEWADWGGPKLLQHEKASLLMSAIARRFSPKYQQSFQAGSPTGTADIAHATADVLHKTLGDYYSQSKIRQKCDWLLGPRGWIPAKDFLNQNIVTPKEIPPLSLYNEKGTVTLYDEYGDINEQLKASIQSRILEITWPAMVNDAIGLLRTIPPALNRAAMNRLYQLTFGQLYANTWTTLEDGKALFAANHGSGTESNVTANDFAAASGIDDIAQAMSQFQYPGQPVDATVLGEDNLPTRFLVGWKSRTPVREALGEIKSGANNDIANVQADSLEQTIDPRQRVVVDANLRNQSTNQSNKDVYAFSDYSPTIAVAYLEGFREPQLITQDAENSDARIFREVIVLKESWCIGSGVIGWRSAYAHRTGEAG